MINIELQLARNGCGKGKLALRIGFRFCERGWGRVHTSSEEIAEKRVVAAQERDGRSGQWLP